MFKTILNIVNVNKKTGADAGTYGSLGKSSSTPTRTTVTFSSPKVMLPVRSWKFEI